MAKLDLRVRLVGKVLARTSVAHKSEEQILADQQRTIKHNPVVDWVLGGMAPGVKIRNETAAGAEGRIPVRVYRPKDAADTLPLVVLIHGGGWTVGNLDIYDGLASTIARDARAVVVSLEYRLAPAHPWPAAAEDCYAALLEVAERAAEWEADAGRLAVVGDSAGGNLAAVLTLMSRDRSGPAIAFQGLIYPATDLTLGSASIEENAHAPILTKEDILRYGSLYVPDLADRSNPYASPLLAPDHTGLPPALIQVAEHDPIRDDGLRYAAALRAVGVPVRVTTYVGMPHGYLAFPRLCRSAPQALAELSAELRRQLTPASVR
ncbi:alpha/beta hydrolase [Arthrobacter sp. zg-Y820]|uniref:alpha/beta hydrolase n=1 Tax=unclassified Arthrobacter TaxID=235627 RepID=UPI001E47379B|nr:MULTISPECIES: alpha/beta hydrolase [unclassified Arthrobacter]MCC9197577.1 alpha/beta hydrolase [Arthrobacter sp. zg-Y820]MDK1280444.1 alpha/beta hydrolase [Arthrobacter sp. zg.Y820]WIB10912.1 alpha/beta hydrolase [Arthrobacter sp. zg-Y820]